ncbi:phosphatidylinositol 3-kinase, root isoform isoform X2 [Brachypodium distachyon]|uniref:phosphatidylinositol 3-kinase, root isoform isoform X2 n=1 Tax=Brachypodium distachyon TaxID=15368 RepID=UPI00052FDC76|nr:phosphatidylinositol 3-kinase, root isoform isoform X2 [Brachypodium distachyon]|eukprot:XP_010234573.1 phosphatidylinositol 3-kinase, root isoform isoform X2 [Brachypodium distachyon]
MPSMAADAQADRPSCGSKDSRFFLSHDIGLPIAFRVDRLIPDHTLLIESSLELFVECALYIDGIQFGLTVDTRLESSGPIYCWNELMTLSIKYRDLTPLSQLAFTVWNVSAGEDRMIVGGATVSLFNSKKQLKTGRHRLRIWPKKMADGSLPTSTPGKVSKTKRDEMERLERVANKYKKGQIQHIDWLARLTFRAVDKMEEESERIANSYPSLIVELCSFEHKVIFQESGANFRLAAPLSLVHPSKHKLIFVSDPNVGQINPSEHKQLMLARSLARGMIDRNMKPSSNERKLIQTILKYPPTHSLSLDEKQLLWKFRFSLMSEKKALAKFLLSVEWSDTQEAKQAVALIRRWETIDVADALGLLSAVFQNEEVRAYAVSILERANDEEIQCYLPQLAQALRFERSDKSHLALFLVRRSLSNFGIASFLRWYLIVELHDPTHARRYYRTYDQLEESIMTLVAGKDGGEDGFQLWLSMSRQSDLTAQLRSITKDLMSVKRAQSKAEKLEQLLSGVFSELTNFSEVIQMFSLMDRLLKSENLDLHLTPYRVLATDLNEGLVEFIPSSSLAKILQKHGSIISYLQIYHPDKEGPFGITALCLESFVKSCAGYCVITYILGIGDRHLDNLLLRDDGRLFHVDFSFMLGEEPHRFAPSQPPMKLCKEMVEAMGGVESQYYARFKSYCCEAYNILRKSSNLILNLFHLMSGSNIPSITEKGIFKLQENFRLDLEDEEAVHFFQELINESISALFPQVVETIHRWVQSRR